MVYIVKIEITEEIEKLKRVFKMQKIETQ